LLAVALHEVVDERVDGLGGVVLVSPAADLRAGFVPQAGMVGYSLRHRGDELLGQRAGLSALRAVAPGDALQAEFRLRVR
jgi:hypothetical protein